MRFRSILPALCGSAALLAGPPDPGPARNPACALGPVAYQTFAEGTYLHLRARATVAELATQAPALAKRLSGILKEAGFQTFGPLLLIQRGATEDPGKPFDLEVGLLVPKDTKPFGEAKVRPLAAFPCATTVAAGDFAGEGGQSAFKALFQAAAEQGRVPTGEFRELLLFWEHQGSANNLMQFQIGLQ